jgi:hypothetical protein
MAGPPAQSHQIDVENNDAGAMVPTAPPREHITGAKLVCTLVAVTLAYFLAMLDTTIVGTVSHYLLGQASQLQNLFAVELIDC